VKMGPDGIAAFLKENMKNPGPMLCVWLEEADDGWHTFTDMPDDELAKFSAAFLSSILNGQKTTTPIVMDKEDAN
jgi:hypothetical protein